MASPSPLKIPLQPSDWIRAALARLAADGIESVRVEVLARDLHVSKGSFYWHFHDREELLGKMLAHWEVDEQARLGSPENQTAAQRWAWFVKQNSTEDHIRLELAVRGWGRKDAKVAAAVAKAGDHKLQFIAGVLSEIGFEKSSAESWAEVVLLVWLGWLDRAANRGGSESKGAGLGDLLSKVVLAASESLSSA